MAITQKQIRESLINQLQIKGADVDLFLGLIEDYLFFNAQEKKMQADIKKKAQKIFRTGLTSHYAPATDGNEGVSLFSLHLHHAFLAFSSPTLSPS